jgi:hypothetical protein
LAEVLTREGEKTTQSNDHLDIGQGAQTTAAETTEADPNTMARMLAGKGEEYGDIATSNRNSSGRKAANGGVDTAAADTTSEGPAHHCRETDKKGGEVG